MKKYLISALALVLASASIDGKVVLPAYFSNNMVVQQKTSLKIAGKSNQKGTVTIKASWDKKTTETQINADGTFSATISTPKAGGPFTITFNDGDVTTLSNVLSGEVWFCSGQSNMEMPVKGWGKVKDYEKELQEGNYPSIRLLQSKRVVSNVPTDNLQINGDGWAVCSTASLENFSALAYFYARYLWNNLHIPIGVIDSSWGGTPAEAWTSNEMLKDVIGYQSTAKAVLEANGNKKKLERQYRKSLEQWQEAYDNSDKGMSNGQPKWINEAQTGDDWNSMTLPSAWEYRGLPGFDGIVWFQKEITIPEDWAGKDIKISLSKIDDNDETYFNGKLIGTTNGFDTQRAYIVLAPDVKAGKATITIRVKDTGGDGGLWGEKENMYVSCGDNKISLAGDWHYQVGVTQTELPKKPESPSSQNFSGNLYNAMVYPYRDFPVKGAIWYQGEANVEQWVEYTPLFQAMIKDWRNTWNSNLPFYYVQLANYMAPAQVQPNSSWAHLREAQLNALNLENTNMAVIMDIGETYDIHPKNKQEVGARLAKAALAHTYGKGTYELALLDNFKIVGNKMNVTFSLPVYSKGNEVKGFVIAGPDMKFHEAKATINGKNVTVWSDEVQNPVAVRYAWADNPQCNLYSNGELPVSPFRTDSYK